MGLIAPIVAAANAADAAAPPSVSTLIPPGRSEHGYEIPPSKLEKLNGADLVVLVGLGLEPAVDKFLTDQASKGDSRMRPRRVIRFADVVGVAADPHDQHHDHGHGPDADHDHEHHHHAVDPHLWLDPVLVEKLVAAVTTEVSEAVKDDAAAGVRVWAAGEALRERIRGIHESYASKCATFASKTIVVGHDAWQRLAARYGLETVAIAGLAATEPTPAALERARQTMQEKKLKVLFIEPQLSDKAGRMIAAKTGAEVRRLDPLGDGDWFAMMEGNLKELERALGAPAPALPGEKK